MFSIDCAVNAQDAQELLKALDMRVPVESNRLAGYVVSEEQFYYSGNQLHLKNLMKETWLFQNNPSKIAE